MNKNIIAMYEANKSRRRKKDTKMAQVRLIREGDMRAISRNLFPDGNDWQESLIGNPIDRFARDLGTQLASMPTVSAQTTAASSDRQRKYADNKTRILMGYATNSNLSEKLQTASDKFVTYGFIGWYVDVDVERKVPVIRHIDPLSTYYEKDANGNLTDLFEVKVATAGQLKTLYPDASFAINGFMSNFKNKPNDTKITILFHRDKDNHSVVALGATEGKRQGDKPALLSSIPNPIGKLLGYVSERPGEGEIPRGHFDDLVQIQIAQHHMARLAIKNTDDAVNAPIIVPNDMSSDMPYGPDAIIRTNDPKSVVRMPTNNPQEVFYEQNILQQELERGAGIPASRSGNMSNSVITGKGIEQLSQAFNSSVGSYQSVLGRTLQVLFSLCLELDETIFGDEEKEISSANSGAPFNIKYRASRDIGGDYTCNVTYGLGAGLDPSQWVVWNLQLQQSGLISKQYIRENSPFDIDRVEEDRRIKAEALEDTTLLALQGLVQSIPALAAQGGDINSIINYVRKAIGDVNKGKTIVESFYEATTPDPEPEAVSQEEALMAQMSGGGGPIDGIESNGMPEGIAYGQQGQAPGTRATLQSLMSSMDTSGNAVGRISTSQRRAIV